MRQPVRFILCLCLIGGLAACSTPFQPNPEATLQDVEIKHLTASALLTTTARTSVTRTPASNSRPGIITVSINMSETPVAPTPSVTETQVPASTRPPLIMNTPEHSTPVPERSALPSPQRVEAPCNLAQPGRFMDVTVPDDTVFRPGDYFSKTWRLVNAGSCTWTPEYAVMWFSGESLGVKSSQAFDQTVKPGQAVDVTVEMIAPEAPGTYQSNWKLRGSGGDLFGIGPNGEAPFWVRIVVIPVETPTEMPTLSATATPLVAASGALLLTQDHPADFDHGIEGVDAREDLLLQPQPDGSALMVPANGSRFILFGLTTPGLVDCLQAPLSPTPLPISGLQPGTYFCYRTAQGLPGRFSITAVDQAASQVNLDYVTWLVP